MEIVPICCVPYVYTHPCVLCALCIHTSLCAQQCSWLTTLLFSSFSIPGSTVFLSWCLVLSHIFLKWEYVSDVISDSLRYAEIDFFSFPRWQEYHLDMGYWLLSILSRLWIWVSFNFWNFRWFECYSSSFYCESNFVWSLKEFNSF